MFIYGWDDAQARWGQIPLHYGMQVGHNFDLGTFSVVDDDDRTGLVMVRRAEDEGVFPTRRKIEPPLAIYHVEELRSR